MRESAGRRRPHAKALGSARRDASAPLLERPADHPVPRRFRLRGDRSRRRAAAGNPKGTLPHRTVGWAWALLMILVAGSSLFVHTIRTWGPWSPIHLLVVHARSGSPRRPAGAPAHVEASSFGDELDLHPGAGRHGSVHPRTIDGNHIYYQLVILNLSSRLLRRCNAVATSGATPAPLHPSSACLHSSLSPSLPSSSRFRGRRPHRQRQGPEDSAAPSSRPFQTGPWRRFLERRRARPPGSEIALPQG